MKHIPKYLLPRIASVAEANAGEDAQSSSAPTAKDHAGFVPFTKSGRGRGRGRGRGGKFGNSGRGKKKSDPLKKFR
jgi:ATP-dependent RNA helicase DDX56/DBP9